MPRNGGRGTNFYAQGIRNNDSGDDDNKCDGLNNSGAAFTPNAGDRALVEKRKGNKDLKDLKDNMVDMVKAAMEQKFTENGN